MTERWQPARKYRDIFERIKSNVMDAIAQGNHQPTRTVGLADPVMTEPGRTFSNDFLPAARVDYAQMVMDPVMTEQCRTFHQALPAAARTDYAQMISDMAKDRVRGNSDGTLSAREISSMGQGTGLEAIQNQSGMMQDRGGHNPHPPIAHGPELQFGDGNSHGNLINSGLMFDLEDTGDVMLTDWDLANIAWMNNTNANL